MENTSDDKYEQTKKVYEQIGDSYIKGVAETLPVELPEFISLLVKGDKVLEVGTAGGKDAKRFTDAGMKVVGTDVVDNFLTQARKLVPEATFLNMDMRNLTFNEEEFDAIWANAVLLHAKRSDVPKIIKNFHKILKPGGKVHIRVKEGEGEAYREEQLSDGKKRFFTYYSKPEIEHMLKGAGFRVIRSETMDDEKEREDTKWVSVWGEKISR